MIRRPLANRHVLPAGLIVLAAVLLGAMTLVYPFGRDQGAHAFIAAMQLDGAMVYRDLFNMKPPATTFMHMLALALFGETMTAIRILDLIVTAGTALLVYAIGCALSLPRLFAGLGAVVYLGFYYATPYWFVAQTDGWAMSASLAGVALTLWPVCRGTACARPLTWHGVAGLCYGLGFLFKFTIGLVPLGLALFAAWRLRAVSPRAVLAGFAATLCGAILVIGGVAAWMSIKGGLLPYLATLDWMRHYVGGEALSLAQYPEIAGEFFGSVNPWLTPLAGAALVAALLQALGAFGAAGRGAAGLVLILAAAALGSALVQGKLFPYHWLPLYPVFGLSVAVAATGVAHALSAARVPFVRIGLTALCLATVVINSATGTVGTVYREAYLLAWGHGLEAYWRSGRFEERAYSLIDTLDVVDFLNRAGSRGAPVFVFGTTPMIYFLSDRPPVSRFHFVTPLVHAQPDLSARDAFMEAFAAAPPRYLIVQGDNNDVQEVGHTEDSATSMMRLTAFSHYVARHYEPVARFGRFDVFERRLARPNEPGEIVGRVDVRDDAGLPDRHGTD